MKTVGDAHVLRTLVGRLSTVTPDLSRRWGTLSPHEMLCHLGDSVEMVLQIRKREKPIPQRHRRVLKAVGLWTPFRWPHGWKTNPLHDPRDRGTKPSVFDADRARAIASLQQLAAAVPAQLDTAHGLFGVMSLHDWQRWAYKHTDHHLRQFGR